jgi:peptidoglycan/xylan/chitin deacetylase (PgdA/CDA1 family)
MNRFASALLSLGLLIGAVRPAAAQTAEVPAPAPALSPNARVAVLGYHRFENPARDSLAITPEMFRRQMQQLKDAGITVISMEDFLAWRRGEKEIPEKSAVITIDDGFNCTYHRAWPILQEFGYPFAIYVYSDYISKGGRSITWEQLAELRDAGVHIGAHSVAHDFMTRPRRVTPPNYEEWLENEFTQIRNEIREKLGVEATTFAYPYGVHNEAVREMGRATGYEALFTVAGKLVTRDTPADEIGRFIVQSDKPETFRAALNFGPAQIAAAGAGGVGAPGVAVNPPHGTTITDDLPTVWIDLSSWEEFDPKTLEMRVSGLGAVPATFDPESKRLSFPLRHRLHGREVTVQVRARAGSRRLETAWSFQHDPSGMVLSESLLEPPKNEEPPET